MTAPRSAVAILAGGRATRLGGALKPLLVVGGQRIIDRQLAVLRPLFEEIVLVTNDAAAFAEIGVALVPDRVLDQGPLGGVDAALAHFAVRAPGASVVCLGGDMPFLVPALLGHLRDAPAALALVPCPAGRPEPLCARYGPGLAGPVAAALGEGKRALHGFLAQLPATYLVEEQLRRLDPDLLTFTNVNTPQDLAAANDLAGSTVAP